MKISAYIDATKIYEKIAEKDIICLCSEKIEMHTTLMVN
jgi:hypothetical protein